MKEKLPGTERIKFHLTIRYVTGIVGWHLVACRYLSIQHFSLTQHSRSGSFVLFSAVQQSNVNFCIYPHYIRTPGCNHTVTLCSCLECDRTACFPENIYSQQHKPISLNGDPTSLSRTEGPFNKCHAPKCQSPQERWHKSTPAAPTLLSQTDSLSTTLWSYYINNECCRALWIFSILHGLALPTKK